MNLQQDRWMRREWPLAALWLLQDSSLVTTCPRRVECTLIAMEALSSISISDSVTVLASAIIGLVVGSICAQYKFLTNLQKIDLIKFDLE